jgi:FAD/FMN-containing dehydrogenase
MSDAVMSDFGARLQQIVGPAGLVQGSEAQAPYLTDWLGKWQGRSCMVVRPASTDEVAQVVRLCHDTHTPLVPQGGHTGMSGGGTPDASGAQLVLSTTRMTRIREIDPLNNTLTVDAGVLLAQAQAAASEVERYFPLALGSEGSCTVGGNLATNAGGTAVLRYGNMRDLVLGLEVVLPDGRVWNGLRGLRKDNTGYDLRGLFIGSEGTLGVITGAVLKLFAKPRVRATAWVGAATLGAVVELLAALREQCGERLTAFEMMSAASLDLVLAHVTDTRPPLANRHAYTVLVELADVGDPEGGGLAAMLEAGLGQALAAGQIEDAMLARSETQARALWKLREGVSQAQLRAGKAVKHDIALPISRLAAFVEAADRAVSSLLDGGRPGRIVNFGHIGDGNLHYNVLLPADTGAEALDGATRQLNRVVHDLVAAHAGSISAEHGVGQLRRDELKLYKPAIELELMLRIKRALDPNQIMNAGKLL